MNLNLVETTVSIAGSNVVFTKLILKQKMFSHHDCVIEVDYDAFGDKSWLADPIKIINYIGESLVINFVHKETGDSNTFIGLVKNIRFVGAHGADNDIIIEGTSETVKLSGMPNMDSFVNKTLEELVSESVKNSGNGAAVIVKPEYKQPISYQMQYNESCWSYLNRLAFLYGESLYSKDGSDVFFGKPELDDAININYDIDVTHFELKASLMPPKFKHYNYIQSFDEEKLKETRKDVPDAAGYLQPALSKSEMIYTSDVTTPVGALVHDPDSLLKMIDIERTREVAKMLVLSGESQTCKIGLGRVITVNFPGNLKISTSPGAFVVTEITHTVDLKGHYSNAFSGTRAALGYIPMEPVLLPVAASQRATVLSNADPEGRGRIKVQFQWQKYTGKETNWIRVASSDAGGTGYVTKNRGYVFIPEVGDEVMIQFEDNDPARPYCSGSLFPETVGKGGGADNHLKTIMTRSGHTIALDDAEGSLGITIKDRKGNLIHIDSANNNITVTALNDMTLNATETMTFNCKNMNVNVGENQNNSIGKDQMTNIGNIQQTDVGDTISITATNMEEIYNNNADTTVGEKQSIVAGESDLLTEKGDIVIKAAGKSLVQGAKDARVSRG